MSAKQEPVPFEVYEPGVHLHGTKADLTAGGIWSPAASRTSNKAGR